MADSWDNFAYHYVSDAKYPCKIVQKDATYFGHDTNNIKSKNRHPRPRGQPNPPDKIQQIERFKRLHVGMTRPRHLLCMALDGSHMTGDICSLLVNKGWQIKDLRQQQP